MHKGDPSKSFMKRVKCSHRKLLLGDGDGQNPLMFFRQEKACAAHSGQRFEVMQPENTSGNRRSHTIIWTSQSATII